MATHGSLQVKDGKFYAVLSIKTNRLDKNGKPVYKSKWVKTGYTVKGNKRKAEEALRNICAEYDMKNMEYDDIYFSDYILTWLEDTKSEIRDSTLRGYEGKIRNQIIPYFSARKIKLIDLTTMDLEAFYNYLSTDNSRFDGKGSLSPRTIKHIHRIINKCLNDAVRKGILKFNVAVSAKTPKSNKTINNYLDEKEIKELLHLIKGSVIEVPVVLCALYGLRRGEVLGLKWQNVNLISKTITISETLQQSIGGSIIVPPKTDSSYRTFPIPDSLYKFLTAHKEDQKRKKELLKGAYIDSDYVCTMKDGRVISPNYLTRTFHKIITKSELPTIRLHDLRHSVASNLINKGFSIVQVADWLGHSSSATTLAFYAHTDKTGKMNIANSIGKTFIESNF